MFLFVTLLASKTAYTQNGITVNQVYQGWYDYTETMRIENNWSVTANLSERNTFDPVNQSQFVIRVYGLYHFKSKWSVGTGLASFSNWNNKLLVPEIRPEQWLFLKQSFEKVKWLSLWHRYKVEERWNHKSDGDKLTDGYLFTMRFRYRFGADFTLYHSKENRYTTRFFISDEILINAGKTIVYNVFDQNRISAGVSFSPIQHLTISVNYLNIYRQRSSGNKFDDMHILRVGIEHEFSILKKENN